MESKAILVKPLSPEMAAVLLELLKNVPVPFEAAEKVLEIRLALEALAEGRHTVADAGGGDNSESPQPSSERPLAKPGPAKRAR